jgi:hypothetical protein
MPTAEKLATCFDWTELRFRTLALVSFLDISKLLSNQKSGAESRQTVKRRDERAAGSLEEPSPSLAGWSRLLGDTSELLWLENRNRIVQVLQ